MERILMPQTPEPQFSSQDAVVARYRCNPIERLTSAVREHASVVVVTGIAQCTGQFDADRLRDALQRVQLRHAKLRVNVERDQRTNWVWFVERAPTIPIPCVFREVPCQPDLNALLTVDDGAPFIPGAAPLARLAVLSFPEANTTCLVGTFHHIAFDAAAVWTFFQDLLGFYLDPQQPIERAPHGFEAEVPGRPWQRGDLSWIARTVWQRLVLDRFQRLAAPPQSPQPRLSVAVRLWSSEETTELIARCRQEQVRVTGALAAASMAGFIREFGGEGQIIPLVLPRTVRAEYAPPVASDAIGSFITMQHLRVRLCGDPRRFWSEAAQLSGLIQRQWKEKDPLRPLRLAQFLPLPRSRRKPRTEKSSGMVINNFGRLTSSPAVGVSAVRDFVCLPPRPPLSMPLTMNTCTIDDRFSMMLYSPQIPESQLCSLLNHIDRSLRGALQSNLDRA